MGARGFSRREFLASCGKGLFCLALSSFPLLSREVHASEKGRLEGEWGWVGGRISPYFHPLAEKRYSAPSVHGSARFPQEGEATAR